MAGKSDIQNVVQLPYYNKMFDTLVEHDDDIRGLIAYSIYKREKHAWIRDFKEKYKKRPDDDEMEKFLVHYNDRKIDELLNNADSAIDDVARKYVGGIAEKLERNYNARMVELNNLYKPRPFWKRVKEEAVVTVCSIIMLGIIAFFAGVAVPTWQYLENKIMDTATVAAEESANIVKQ